MTILSTDTKDDIRRLHDIWVARLAYEFRCERTDVLAAIHSAAPAANPVKPTDPQAKHAAEGTLSSEPGEVQDRCVSTSPTPSEPQPTSTPAVQAQDPLAVTQAIDVHSTSLPGAEGAVDLAPNPSRADRMRALFAKGKQPTAKEAQIALDYAGTGPANRLAAKLGLTFRKVTKEEMRANGLATREKQVAQQRAKRDATSEALKGVPAKPREPVKRSGPPTPRADAPTSPAATPAEPFDDDEPTPVVRRVMKAPAGRFYLRDKVTGHYVHQSLQQSATTLGPMMTSDRKWAWFDNMDRYRGAKKKWPELAEMRKEGAAQ